MAKQLFPKAATHNFPILQTPTPQTAPPNIYIYIFFFNIPFDLQVHLLTHHADIQNSIFYSVKQYLRIKQRD